MRARLITILCLVLCGVGISFTTPVQAQTSDFQLPVSPTVLASVMVRDQQLALLVLWRGSPAWYWREKAGLKGSGGTPDGTMFQLVAAGGLLFRIEYDFVNGAAIVNGTRVALQDVNVVLIDQVDGAVGPRVVGTKLVKVGRDSSLRPEILIIRNDPALFEFLQCDLPLAPALFDIGKQQVITAECDRVRTR